MQKAKFALLASALLGLSSCAPIWPLSGDRANIPNYVASNVDPATCKPLKPTYWPARQPAVQRLSNDGDQALACAQLSVQLLTNRYNLEKHEIEAVRKASVVSLFGLGTTAGVNIAQDASKNQLQRLGLYAAGVAGADAAFGAAKQHEIYDDEIKALECVMRTDAALSLAEGAPRTYFDLNAINTLSNNLVGQFLPAPGSTEASRFASATAARALTVLVDAVSSNASLVAALSADANREKRAKELVIARDDINYAVEDALFGNAEPSKIFDTMKSNLKKQAGGSVDAAASAQSHNKEAMQTFTTMALVQTESEKNRKAMQGFQAQLKQDWVAQSSTQAAVDVLTKVFADCVGMAPPPAKGGDQGGSS